MVTKTKNRSRRLGIASIVVAVLLALVFHDPLITWFAGDSREPASGSSRSRAHSGHGAAGTDGQHGGDGANGQHASDGASSGGDEISHYTCSMHPWVKEQDPKRKCPVCSMDLTPVTVEEVRSGIIRMDQARRQAIGVRTATIGRGPQVLTVRVIGEVAYDQTRLADVTLKFGGWIKDLRVNETGKWVRKGSTLFTIYSPELFAAQQEYLVALEEKKNATTDPRRARAQLLLRASKKRLQLLDVSNYTLERIAARNKPLQYIPISAPASGHVVEKNVVEGGTVEVGKRLFRIAALDKVWVEGRVYERDIPLLERGQKARVSLPHLPGRAFEGTVTFIYPYLDGARRTARVRIELDNSDLELKPHMYANVELQKKRGERLLVPESAVVYSGPRRIVFVDVKGDRFRPQQVKLGAKSGSLYEVRSGLKAGDEVAVSGIFLLSAESRLKATTGIW